MFPWNDNRNEGTFACSPGAETGTRAHSPKPLEQRKPERGFLPARLQKLVGEFFLNFCREIVREIWPEFSGIFFRPTK